MKAIKARAKGKIKKFIIYRNPPLIIDVKVNSSKVRMEAETH